LDIKNDELMKVETRDPQKKVYSAISNGNLLKRDLENVQDVLDNLVEQTNRNKKGY
jgi:hypothetical protein